MVFWALLAHASCVQAAGIYASRDADGTMRYATHRLDPSYELIFSEAEVETAPKLEQPAPSKARLTARARRLRPLIERIAARHGVTAELVEAVVNVESGFNPSAISPKGARGAMQLMPATARRYGITDQRQLARPEKNIEAGVLLLKELLARYHGNIPLALAAYNAGSGSVARHGDRIPPYRETMLYVPAVLVNSMPAQRP